LVSDLASPKLAQKWTTEMLNLPGVWSAVERLAKSLMERGVIEGCDGIFSICEMMMFGSF
jgi:hypothetical protein